MSNAPLSPIRIIALVLIAVVAGLDVLGSMSGALYSIPDKFAWNWNGHADLLTPRYPFIDSWAEVPKNDGATYAGVIITSDDALPVPRALQAAALALASLVRILGGTLIVIIAIRLLARKTVTGIARWGLIALGILIMLTATVGPQLQVLSVNIAVEELGYPVAQPNSGDGYGYTEDSPEEITPGLLGIWAIGPTDSLLFVTGAMIAALGFLLAEAIRRLPAIDIPRSVSS
jgi:hypothetical protein